MRIPGLSSFSRSKLCRELHIVLVIGLALAFRLTAVSAESNPAAGQPSPEDAEAAYRKVIEERVTKIVAPLHIEDHARAAKVHALLVNQYRNLRDWHEANDASRKKATGEELDQINASLTAIHAKFIQDLNAELTPEQMESVKDAMTYGKVQFTFKGYLVQYPGLTEEQKQKVLELLKEARELAMDGGSSDEKTAIFNKYKGRINNWLAAQGMDVGKKKKTAPAATNAPSAM